jgi:hypothetical protein
MCVREETTRRLGERFGDTTMSHQECMDALLCRQGLSVSDKLAAEVRPVGMNGRQNYTCSSETHRRRSFKLPAHTVTLVQVGTVTVLEYSESEIGTTRTSESSLRSNTL